MNLFFIKVFFAFCICDACWGYEFTEDKAEFVTEEEVSNVSETESIHSLEYEWRTLLTKHPEVVVMELHQVLLEKVKSVLVKDNKTYQGKITLATFDSAGLQDVHLLDDYAMFHDAVLGLNSSFAGDVVSSPSMHVLVELLRGNISQSTMVLVTKTKPNDEHLILELIRTFLDKNCRLSVLWVGNQSTNDYSSLKTIAEKTGGKFIVSDSINEGSFYLGSNSENMNNHSDKIRFPERNTENEEEVRFTPRAADQKVIQKAVVPLIVEVASGSSLEVRPGTSTQIQFTVKNNMNVAVPAFFNAKYNGIVQHVQPPQALLPPTGTVTVIVNLQPIGSAQNANALGTLTLFAAAANRVTARSALISMGSQVTKDNTAPKMYYKYEGDCSNYKEPQNCEHGQWNLEVTLQDEDSGLLKILSEPYGLLFHNEFIAGSKTPVTVYYSATCCQPVVHVWGEDLKGNYVKKSFDVFNQTLLAGEVASIVLGVLLLLLIIIVIIAAIVLVRRRNQRNLIIPRPRSGSR